MTVRVVIDTNIWIRILLRGRVTLPILDVFNENKFQLVMSHALMDELHLVAEIQKTYPCWLRRSMVKPQSLCLGMMIYELMMN
ncbi:MAG: PIN domain-containing protein [Leptolyngbyaceae cyanobacterium bins.302]|nr:PIN domain-containing protein [Leptolyngbyaceae cyanobacterium bins.302]